MSVQVKLSSVDSQSVTCPTCFAATGENCVTTTQGRSTPSHRTRIDAAGRAAIAGSKEGCEVIGPRVPGQLTREERLALRAERAALTSPFERIAFDNRWIDGVPLGLILMAHEDEDAAPSSEVSP